MSAAIDFDYQPECDPSAPPRRLRTVPDPGTERPGRFATVSTLHRLPERATAAPLRLTRRGVRVVTAAVAVLAGLLVAVARMSATAAPATTRSVPASVTVRPGDTLWSIATRLDPQGDPRAEVAQLQRINGLGAAGLVPGQVLRTR